MTGNITHYGLRVFADYSSVVFGAGEMKFSGDGVLKDGTLTLHGEGELCVSGEVTLRICGSGRLTLHTEQNTFFTAEIIVGGNAALTIVHRGTIDHAVRCVRRVTLEQGATYHENIALMVSGMFDDAVFVEHRAASTSHTESRIAVAECAKAISRSTIHVTKGAAGSEGTERIRALLLGKKAEVDLLPVLHVDTHDVTCKHSASTGHLDENTLFYLASRGLDVVEAKEVLVQAFLSL